MVIKNSLLMALDRFSEPDFVAFNRGGPALDLRETWRLLCILARCSIQKKRDDAEGDGARRQFSTEPTIFV